MNGQNIKRKTAGNRRLAKKRVQCLNEALCPENRDFVLAESLVLRNLQLLVAANRCVPFDEKDSASI